MAQKKKNEKKLKPSEVIPEMFFTPTGTVNVTHDANNINGMTSTHINSGGDSIRGRRGTSVSFDQANEQIKRKEILARHGAKKKSKSLKSNGQ